MTLRSGLGWLLLPLLLLAACAAPAAQPAAKPAAPAPAPPAAAAAPAAPPAATANAADTSAAGRFAALKLDPPQTVRFSYTQIAAESPVFLAIDHGYFAELGINAELIPMTNASDTMPMLTANQLDVGSQAISPAFFNAVVRNVGIRMVGDRGSNLAGKSTVSLAIRQDILDRQPWTGYSDLKGMRLAATANDIQMYYIERFLQLGGLTWQDIDVAVPFSFPDMAVAFANGAIDAAMFNEPWATQLEQQNMIKKVAYVGEAAPGWHTSGILFGEPFAQRTQLARNTMIAWLLGVRHYWDAYAGKRDFKDVLDVLQKYTPVKDEALIRKIPQTAQNPNGTLDPAKIEASQDWFIARGWVTDKADLSKALDMSFAEYAVGVLGTYELPR